ncbi:nucleotidyltransferase family protein [Aliarcobacter cryaerophilus]|uniref:nucleotidyltransferase family protein n=1 Tax=Aliarcobacter cryaerophilus TaxID=28198 RepID=UPI0008337D83|nr:nucleotidyltransferase family protein [Aliarcobacter cryaerophilus]
MTAIILAGGLGSRLKEVVMDIPKPMANINNKPFLSYILEYLNSQSIKKVILSVGYKSDIIIDFYDKYFKDIEIVYSIENQALGTGGAIKKALSMTNDNYVIVLNGDTFFKVDLELLFYKIQTLSADLIIALKVMENCDRYGSIKIDQNGKIILFEEKRFSEKTYINSGTYLLDRKVFLNKMVDKVFSFEDFLSTNINTINSYGIVVDNFFIDIGIPEDYNYAKYCCKEFK